MSRHDLAWAFAPLHIVAKLVGVIPLEVRGDGLRQWGLVLFWTTLTSSFFVLALGTDFVEYYPQSSVSLILADVTAVMLCWLSAITCHAATLPCRRDEYNLATNLLNIVTKDMIVDERRYFTIRVTTLLAFATLCGFLTLGYWHTISISDEIWTYKLLFLIITTLSGSIGMVQFCLLFSALKNSFSDLNSRILSLFYATSETDLDHLLLGTLTTKTLRSHEGKTVAFPVTPVVQSHGLEKKIQSLRRCHLVLHDVGMKLEHYFSVSVLIALGKTFISIVRCGHSVIAQLAFARTGYFSGIINSFLWASIDFVKMVAICFICDAVASESSKIGKILSKIAALQPQGSSSQLDAFLTQATVTFKRNDVMAGGFLSINKTLAFSIVSATVTYLIIISQFM